MKKAISVLLCLCLTLSVFTVVPFAASAAEVTEESVGATSGTTGSCRWSLDDEGNLTISGNGAMGDYSSQKLNGTWITTAPWGANIKTVIIEDGVTYIGSYAFYGCTGLTSVTIPDSVTSIGSNSFYGCTGLTSITIPDSLANIEGYAFNNTAWYNNQPDGMVYAGRVTYSYKGTMPDNTSIIIRDGTKGIAGSAFERCNGLRSVIIPDSVTSIGFGSLGYNWGRKKIDGLTIYGVPGSAAEQYANDNGFTFIEYVDAAIGDMTGDGKVNVRDVTAMQRHLAGLEELTDDRLALADTNGDGKVDINDATHLQRYLAEFDVTIG